MQTAVYSHKCIGTPGPLDLHAIPTSMLHYHSMSDSFIKNK